MDENPNENRKNNDRKEKTMTNKELTELMIKQLLHEWKREKSITTAYDICDTLCEYYKINEKDENEITQ